MKVRLCIVLLISSISLQSCGDGMIKNKINDWIADHLDTPDRPAPKMLSNKLVIKNAMDLTGYWVGMFEPDSNLNGIYTGEYKAWDYSNKINISIDEIIGDDVKGHSVVAGNDRPFSGTLSKIDSTFHVKAKEPGDDKYDGEFQFNIAKGDTTITGIWKAYKKIRIPRRTYTLSKKNFIYNPNLKLEPGRYIDWKKTKKVKDKYVEGDDEAVVFYDSSYFTTTDEVNKYNASTDEMTREKVANMKKADLFILRNSIYARHGYSFKDQQLRAYFDRQTWYIPISANIKSQFTDLEKRNISLLMRYEKNAKEYYDVFGRG